MVYKVNVQKKLIKNYSVRKKKILVNMTNHFIYTDMFESIRKNEPSNKSKREVPKEYATEIKALEQCCQHRTHCLVYDIAGFLKV
jgi:DNA-binding transcriptional regulator GbsR (MarR family)